MLRHWLCFHVVDRVFSSWSRQFSWPHQDLVVSAVSRHSDQAQNCPEGFYGTLCQKMPSTVVSRKTHKARPLKTIIILKTKLGKLPRLTEERKKLALLHSAWIRHFSFQYLQTCKYPWVQKSYLTWDIEDLVSSLGLCIK